MGVQYRVISTPLSRLQVDTSHHPTLPAECRKGGIATMRKLATASLAGLLALSAPALAQARSHHARHHTRIHHHARIVDFRAAPHSATGTPPGGSSSGTAAEETAGTVTSFENGVLTLTLNDGSKVMGKVTEQTEISCEPAAPTAHEADNGGEDGNQGEGNHDEQNHGLENGDDNGQGDDDQGDQGGEGDEAGSCGPSSLQPGTLVREAKLRIAPGGAVFEEIDLVG
jgi:hypothetical protein